MSPMIIGRDAPSRTPASGSEGLEVPANRQQREAGFLIAAPSRCVAGVATGLLHCDVPHPVEREGGQPGAANDRRRIAVVIGADLGCHGTILAPTSAQSAAVLAVTARVIRQRSVDPGRQ